MSERAHTKGRGWHVVEKLCVGGFGPCVDDGDGVQVACIGSYVANGAEKARLISAAPDMFEALKLVLPVLEAVQRQYAGLAKGRGMGGDGPVLEAVRAALSKASPSGEPSHG